MTSNTTRGFRGINALLMMFVLLIFFCDSGLTAVIRAEKENSIIELASRDELVNWAGYGEQKLSTVVINGKLLCHGNGQTHNPQPVSGASVGVFCGTSRAETRKSWAKATTDGFGEFLIDVPSHLHAIPNLEKICLVKVVHLPKSCSCRHGFTGKHKGIKLTSIGEGIRTYTTHNINLMTSKSHSVQRGVHKRREVLSMS